MIKPKPPAGWPATDVVEEAVALLRRTPAATILCSFIGSVPFWLTLLYFVADMSHRAFAEERLAGDSLSLAVLFLWKKCWQAASAAGLRTVLAGEDPEPWTVGRVARLVVAQAELQFWSLLIRPLAYVLLFPIGWVSAYYQNITVMAAGRAEEKGSLSARAWAQARLWPGQNIALIAILLFLFLVVWINVGAVCGGIPMMLKSLFGIETMASRNMDTYLNSTFFTATGALAFLLVEPVWLAVYVVRCYHGTSLQSGADIHASLRALRTRAGALALLVVLALASTAPAAPTPEARVDAGALDRSIGQTLERREFAWRFRPTEAAAAAKAESGWWRAVKKHLSEFWEATKLKIRALIRWIKDKWFGPKAHRAPTGSSFKIPPIRQLLWGAGAVAAGLLLWAGWIVWRRPKTKLVIAEAVAEAPDLHAADVVADQLPEEGWLALARDLAARGELRLAVRAVYLASLANLGEQQLVSIARHKSNFDYQRELRRRARSRDALLAAFDENLVEFERAWYGDHGVTLPIFEQFTRNLERMRA